MFLPLWKDELNSSSRFTQSFPVPFEIQLWTLETAKQSSLEVKMQDISCLYSGCIFFLTPKNVSLHGTRWEKIAKPHHPNGPNLTGHVAAYAGRPCWKTLSMSWPTSSLELRRVCLMWVGAPQKVAPTLSYVLDNTTINKTIRVQYLKVAYILCISR